MNCAWGFEYWTKEYRIVSGGDCIILLMEWVVDGWNNAVGFVECEVIPRKDDDSWNESDYDVCHWSIG